MTFWILPVLLILWFATSIIAGLLLIRRKRPPYIDPLPDVADACIHEHEMVTFDGEILHTWELEAHPGAAYVLLLHGRDSSMKNVFHLAEMWRDMGYNSLLITLRAHGRSTGNMCGIGYESRLDVAVAVDWLTQHHPEQPIIIHGESLGAAAAIFAAQETGNRVNAYIFDCAYKDFATALRNRTRLFLPRYLEWIAFQSLMCVAPLIFKNGYKFQPVHCIENIPPHTPLLFLAGGKDTRALVSESKSLRDAVLNPSQLIVFENADHVGLYNDNPKRYRQVIEDFINKNKLGKNN